jgi:hypothetical protein
MYKSASEFIVFNPKAMLYYQGVFLVLFAAVETNQ